MVTSSLALERGPRSCMNMLVKQMQLFDRLRCRTCSVMHSRAKVSTFVNLTNALYTSFSVSLSKADARFVLAVS